MCAMVSAYRWGFRFWRPVLLAAVTTVAFVVSVPEAFDLISARDWSTLAVFTLIFFVPAVGVPFGCAFSDCAHMLG